MSTTTEIKTVPLIEVQVISEKTVLQMSQVMDVGNLSQENYERIRLLEPIAFIPASQDILVRDQGQLLRIHFLAFIMFNGPGKDQIDAQKRAIREMPQLFLK